MSTSDKVLLIVCSLCLLLKFLRYIIQRPIERIAHTHNPHTVHFWLHIHKIIVFRCRFYRILIASNCSLIACLRHHYVVYLYVFRSIDESLEDYVTALFSCLVVVTWNSCWSMKWVNWLWSVWKPFFFTVYASSHRFVVIRSLNIRHLSAPLSDLHMTCFTICERIIRNWKRNQFQLETTSGTWIHHTI